MTRAGMKQAAWPVVAMGFVILASNELVQHPVKGFIGSLDLSLVLTWGAFTYPIAFLITDTTNKIFGLTVARRVVIAGFIFGVALSLVAALSIAIRVSFASEISIWRALIEDSDALAMLRTAIASGSAFLVAQLLDVKVFDSFRRSRWWMAPSVSSLIGSSVDTLIFFSLAFAGTSLPWVTWAMGDFCAKILMILLLLYPFRLMVRICRPTRQSFG